MILIIDSIRKKLAQFKPSGTARSAKFSGTMNCFRCPTKTFAMCCSLFPPPLLWPISSKLIYQSKTRVIALGWVGHHGKSAVKRLLAS
jgi:hypothetical protein